MRVAITSAGGVRLAAGRDRLSGDWSTRGMGVWRRATRQTQAAAMVRGRGG